jgi:hypothetical protein
MFQTMGWLAVTMFVLLFVGTGSVMILSPDRYLRLAKGEVRGTSGELLWTRIRGSLLLAVTVWAACHAFLRIK